MPVQPQLGALRAYIGLHGVLVLDETFEPRFSFCQVYKTPKKRKCPLVN